MGGYLTAAVFDCNQLIKWVNSQLAHQSTGEKPQATVMTKAQPPKPKLEFYTLLAKDQSHLVEPSKSTTPQTTVTLNEPPHQATPSSRDRKGAEPLPAITVVDAKPIVPAKSPKQESYLLQIASFKHRFEAERLKAGLTLKGFNVTIVVVSQQQTQWFRVVLGPFHSRQDAEKTKLALVRSEHISGMVRRVDV